MAKKLSYNNVRRDQLREARLSIVGKLYLRGYSERDINREVMARLGLETLSRATTHKDIQVCLAEWHKERIQDMDEAISMELQRIDDIVRECWSQWEKSKEDTARVTKGKRGIPSKGAFSGIGGQDTIKTSSVYEQSTNVIGLGNPAYLAEIRAQLAERRKLLGLYAPEKKEVNGEVSFANLLVESGMLAQAEAEANGKE